MDTGESVTVLLSDDERVARMEVVMLDKTQKLKKVLGSLQVRIIETVTLVADHTGTAGLLQTS